MNRFPLNKRYLTISVYAALVIAAAILFQKAVGSVEEIAGGLGGALGAAARVLEPFLYGFVFAYTINSGVKSLERRVFSRIPQVEARPRLKRLLSIAACYVVVLGCIAWVVAYLVPEVSSNVQRLVNATVAALNSANYTWDLDMVDATVAWVNETFFTAYTTQEIIGTVREQVMKLVSGMPQFVSTLFAGTIRAAYVTLNVFLGLIIAFYMLYEKEGYAALFSKAIYAAFRRGRAEGFVQAAKRANVTFEKFIIGKALDSLIVGLIYFVVCAALNVRYAPLLALIVGVTNMIPYFGPFIGGVPAVLIVMSYDMTMGLWMILIIFVLQQFDGIVLGPKILGDSLGLKPMGIIFSILVGGWLAGVAGMFFGVPIFAVLSAFVVSLIERRYEEKNGLDPEPRRRLLEGAFDGGGADGEYDEYDDDAAPYPDSILEQDHSLEYSQRHKKPRPSPEEEENL